SERIAAMWKDYFALDGGAHPFDRVEAVVQSRPRDYIYFFKRMFESAFNNGNKQVGEKDFSYAHSSYAKYLESHIISEMSAEYPAVVKIVEILALARPQGITLQQLKDISRQRGV